VVKTPRKFSIAIAVLSSTIWASLSWARSRSYCSSVTSAGVRVIAVA